MFVSGTAPTLDELLAAMETYELVLPAARAHHYSNLAYALLGEVVARRAGMPYTRTSTSGSSARSASSGRRGTSRSPPRRATSSTSTRAP